MRAIRAVARDSEGRITDVIESPAMCIIVDCVKRSDTRLGANRFSWSVDFVDVSWTIDTRDADWHVWGGPC